MVSFPEMVRTTSGLCEVRYALGDRVVDRYLEFVAGRARPNTLRAVAFDLKAFFSVVCRDPVEVTAADVFEFLAHQQALYQALADAERPDTAASWPAAQPPRSWRTWEPGRPSPTACSTRCPGESSSSTYAASLSPSGPCRRAMSRWPGWNGGAATAVTSRGPGEQELLHRYAVWHLLRRLRRRSGGSETTHNQLVSVRQHVRAAIVLLDWLTARDLTLATCGQGDLEVWMTSPGTTHRREAGHFVRWASKQKLTSLDFPATKWAGPARTIDTEARWDQARRLLHDTALKPEDRVAGLLVLLYAQKLNVITALTTRHVLHEDDRTLLRLGSRPIVLPAPLGDLVTRLAAGPETRGRSLLGVPSPWLFPGNRPGSSLTEDALAQRLHAIGISPRQGRSTALFALAAEVPAAILAKTLGIHVQVAIQWQKISAGDWTAYAADVSRRSTPRPVSS